MTTQTLKRCSRCKQSQSLSEFHRNRCNRDGHQSFCKECARERSRGYRERYTKKHTEADPRAAVPSKLCPSCEVERPSAEFALDRSNPSGLSSHCSECNRITHRKHYEANRGKVRARNRKWARENPERVTALGKRAHAREIENGKYNERNLAKFGLTPSDFEALLSAQGGGCAICGKSRGQRRLNVDHDHTTGIVRGLLCSGCNGARIGRLGDSPERAEARALSYERRAGYLRAAADYLRNPPAPDVLGGDR